MIGERLAIGRGSVSNQLRVAWRSLCICFWRVCLWSQKVYDYLKTGWSSFGKRSATKTLRGLPVTTATIGGIPTSLQPPKTYYYQLGRREVPIAASNPMDQIVPATSLQPLKHVWLLSATPCGANAGICHFIPTRFLIRRYVCPNQELSNYVIIRWCASLN